MTSDDNSRLTRAPSVLMVSNMAYSKLHSSLVNSSLWTEEDHVRLLFITLLAMCDKDGCVYGSRGGIERAAMLNPDQCDERDPWMVLMSPDKDSSDRIRAPENDGRRIEEISGGFRLLNFSYYRGLRNDDDRAEQNRQAQDRHRKRLAEAAAKQGKPPSAGVSHRQPESAHTEAEAEAEAEKLHRAPVVARPAPSGPAGVVFEHYRKQHLTAKWTAKRKRLIDARLGEGFSVDDLKHAIDGFHADPWHTGENEAHKAWLDLDLLLRDASKVEAGLSFFRDPPGNAKEPKITIGGKPARWVNGKAVLLEDLERQGAKP